MKVPSKKSDTEQFYRAVILGYRTITGTDRSPIIEYGYKDGAPGFIFGSYILEWLRQIHQTPIFIKACKNGDLEMYLLGFFDQRGFDQYKMNLTHDFIENI